MNSQLRSVITYKYLRGISWTSFQSATNKEDGYKNHLITTMLFSAFCLEAFLNHVGQDKIPYWKYLKKSLSSKDKLEVIFEFIKKKPDYSRRPFQSFSPIFKLRNLLVHAETEYLDVEDGQEDPLSKWESQINIDTAQKFLDDTKEMVKLIAEAVGYDPEKIFELDESPISYPPHSGYASS